MKQLRFGAALDAEKYAAIDPSTRKPACFDSPPSRLRTHLEKHEKTMHPHIVILLQGNSAWNKWRDDHPSTRPNLHEAELPAARLKGIRFEDADLCYARLERADLTSAILVHADIGSCYLAHAKLVDAHLEGANASHAHMQGADLAGAHLEGTDLWSADLENSNLTGAHLEKADLGGAILANSLLVDAHLEGAQLNTAFLGGSDLTHAHLEGANLIGAKGLAQQQIEKAFGDADTVLPEDLQRPLRWTETPAANPVF